MAYVTYMTYLPTNSRISKLQWAEAKLVEVPTCKGDMTLISLDRPSFTLYLVDRGKSGPERSYLISSIYGLMPLLLTR